MPNDSPKAPTGLRTPGRRLWNAVVTRYVLTESELAMLAEACRTTDELDRLERAVRALPELTSIGSTGQLRAHPLLNEVRSHRRLLERLTTAMNLPDDDQEIGIRGPSRHARRAIQARWRRERELDGDPSEATGRDGAG